MQVDLKTSNDDHTKDTVEIHVRMRKSRSALGHRKTDSQRHTFHCRCNTEIQLRTVRHM